MESPLRLKVIVGTTRPNRFSEKPSQWIADEAAKKEGVDIELLDLRDYPMPFFDQPISPAMAGGKYADQTVTAWADKIRQADGFIVVTAEYNHGYPAVLKNAIDWLFPEWNQKPVAFVSYGSVGGARAIEQLRQVAIELQMVPTKHAVHIPVDVYLAAMKETAPVNPDVFKPLRLGRIDRVDAMLTELIWAAKALKTAREDTDPRAKVG
jgi:NAD(P)H-dependent FMN reductase